MDRRFENYSRCQTHLKPQDFKLEIRPLQQRESHTAVLRFDQRLQEIIKSFLNAFAQNEPVVAGGNLPV